MSSKDCALCLAQAGEGNGGKSGPTVRVSSWEHTPAGSGVPHATCLVGTGVWDRETAWAISREVTKPLMPPSPLQCCTPRGGMRQGRLWWGLRARGAASRGFLSLDNKPRVPAEGAVGLGSAQPPGRGRDGLWRTAERCAGCLTPVPFPLRRDRSRCRVGRRKAELGRRSAINGRFPFILLNHPFALM